MQPSEHELIAQSLSNNADAYGQLVDRYKDAIYRHCFAIVRDEDTAEDLAQDTFITAYYKLTTFDTTKRLSTWLFKIATNLSLNHITRTKKHYELNDDLMEHTVSTLRSPQASAQDSELHQAVARLAPHYRAVIHLYYFEGLDYKEIATALAKPEGSIKGWMNRAKTQLRKELA